MPLQDTPGASPGCLGCSGCSGCPSKVPGVPWGPFQVAWGALGVHPGCPGCLFGAPRAPTQAHYLKAKLLAHDAAVHGPDDDIVPSEVQFSHAGRWQQRLP